VIGTRATKYAFILLLMAAPASGSSWGGSDFGSGSSSWQGGGVGGFARAGRGTGLGFAPAGPVQGFLPGYGGMGALLTPEMISMGPAGAYAPKGAAWSPASSVVAAAPASGGFGRGSGLGSASWAFSPTDEDRNRGTGPVRPSPTPRPNVEPPAPVPLPPAALLLLGGLATLAAAGRRRA
jgi:hypothetical protein